MSGTRRQLPQGWVEASLEDLVDRLQYGFTAKSSPDLAEPKLLRITDIGEDGVDWETVPGCQISREDLAKYRLSDGDLVFARSGSIEKAYRVSNPPEAVFASYLIRGRPIHKSLGSLLQHFVKTRDYFRQIGAFSAGIAIQNVNAKKLGSVIVPIPPLNEQERIFTTVEALQGRSRRAREALETVPDLLDQLRQSILGAAFRGDLTKQWRKQNPDVEPASELLKRIRAERCKLWEEAELEKLKARGLTGDKLAEEFSKRRKQYKEPAPVDPADLPELPEGQCWVAFGELVSSISYGTARKCTYESEGIGVLRIPNILSDGSISLDDLKRTILSVQEIEQYGLLMGDILLIRSNGSIGLVGRASVVDKQAAGLAFAGYLLRIRPLSLVDPCWLQLALSTPRMRSLIEMTARSTSGVNNINSEEISQLPIPLAPGAEQTQIALSVKRQLDLVGEVRYRQNELLNHIARLDQSVLSKAFRGKLVPQHPSDEPASVLLDRIRKEKAQSAAVKDSDPRSTARTRSRNPSAGFHNYADVFIE